MMDTGHIGMSLMRLAWDSLYPVVRQVWFEELLLRAERLGWPVDRMLWTCEQRNDNYFLSVVHLDHPAIKPWLEVDPEYKMFYPKGDD